MGSKEILKKVGEDLRAAREKKGLTLDALGEAMGGLHKQYLHGVEKGRQSLSLARMVAISAALGYEVEVRIRPSKKSKGEPEG